MTCGNGLHYTVDGLCAESLRGAISNMTVELAVNLIARRAGQGSVSAVVPCARLITGTPFDDPQRLAKDGVSRGVVEGGACIIAVYL